jgi:amino-acid N-acetyltransferase
MTEVTKATIDDAAKIKKLIDVYARKEIMLFRPIYAIYGNIRDYSVAKKGKKVIGCCALHIFGKEYKPGRKQPVIAEIKSLAVEADHQNKGVGTKLVRSCIREAKKMGIDRVFVLTIKENLEFFKRLGFKEIKKSKLPQKIWQECAVCPRFPKDCNEIGLILDI